jgi:serine protease AprX
LKKVFLFISLFISFGSFASHKYWVFFKDKQGVVFSPHTYFDIKAIERRALACLPLSDSLDYPLNRDYKSLVAALADSLGYESRWLNAIAVYSDAGMIAKISALPCVAAVQEMNAACLVASIKGGHSLDKEDTLLLRYQVSRLQGEKFRRKGIDGKGIRIAVLDVGFNGARVHPAFKHLFDNKQVKLTYDFIKKEENVYHGGVHGTSVLSCIAGMYDTIPMGMATGAEFLLARTERNFSEWKDEEEYWLAAAEWADKNGANIISSSLAYTLQRYFIRDMNGRKSIVAHAATIAAKKGILVIAAAGNEGDDGWKYMATPADADSVLTVGGSDPYTDFHIDYSSYGPNAAGHLKPNIIAPAHDIVATKTGYAAEDGTSFATPLIAGFAACAWQLNKGMTNIRLFNAIEQSGHLYPYFDYANGYGIPRAGYFTDIQSPKISARVFKIVESPKDDLHPAYIHIVMDDSTLAEAISPRLAAKHTYIYCHFADSANLIKKYFVIKPLIKNAATFLKSDLPQGGTMRVFMDGYMEEKKY